MKWTSIALVLVFSAAAIGDEKHRVITSDSVDVLKNLGPVSVVCDVNDYAEQEGFTSNEVAKRVGFELAENGLDIVSSEKTNHTNSQGYVYVQVFLIGEQLVLTFNFHERVMLFRDAKTIVIGAQTYGEMYTGPHSSSKSKVWRAISRAVTEFSLKHMQANK